MVSEMILQDESDLKIRQHSGKLSVEPFPVLDFSQLRCASLTKLFFSKGIRRSRKSVWDLNRFFAEEGHWRTDWPQFLSEDAHRVHSMILIGIVTEPSIFPWVMICGTFQTEKMNPSGFPEPINSPWCAE